jgi:hypothetical protein
MVLHPSIENQKFLKNGLGIFFKNHEAQKNTAKLIGMKWRVGCHKIQNG